ncbi:MULTISPECIES: pyridoxamine 5'-phosphate oxidase family protein [Glycomyces]|uniref:Nitroimidazol reductase NimA-like FMN-containing flavoprotein (Pyridoxamine 5'-phosphate oxidase superfamily) n=2 Tax=Glycomyces TaxID=58113 RepID=A0A9X3PL23_9ACTN|nr:pyridoxamine 5'-phosphate oxidase family protein [Glycomyces lechevalierae]MDA1385879.1 pyridoxamine 5'-phosphate oxidase family protein [Glycomyces lechevalierae]MDR7340000.1 nitroimidazol reductase NimA-like FMN-containing flavoprotein (pyridoxamine 5'-phosphate oxidase superfamily) [Glycomyces lechevalierae]
MSALECPYSGQFTPTERTTPKRSRERVTYEREAAYRVLDEALFCDLAFVGPDGAPRVLPTFHVRVGDTLFVHGSTGSSMGLGGREEFAVSATATIVDGLVFSKSWFHHSMNYRSVVVHANAKLVTDADERWTVFKALIDRMAEGRSERSREANDKENAMSALLAIPLEEVSIKQRSGPPVEEPEDEDLPFDNGVAPVTTVVTGRI